MIDCGSLSRSRPITIGLVRRMDKEITTRAEIDEIIRGADVCRLAFAVDGEPYIVPVSFGYDGTAVTFHTAMSGRKIDCIAANNRVCLEFERYVKLIRDAEGACKWTFSYESVIGFGRVHELTTTEAKGDGLNQIMRHYSGREWAFDQPAVAGTRVWRIEIDSITGKRSRVKDVIRRGS